MSSARLDAAIAVSQIDRLLAAMPAARRAEGMLDETDVLIAAAEARERQGTWSPYAVRDPQDRRVLLGAAQILDDPQ
jgi:hypothetical protein